ncbi:unnamed protein product [Paramecium pentaurelia]|uniref:UBC core domain-containing protein n=1 Tax=Paramecium pentaurelia TaxID=43138 RepID=A0A8S1VN27_9CILI|nr:unnamed protein product [Paramecium pentaurelia]
MTFYQLKNSLSVQIFQKLIYLYNCQYYLSILNLYVSKKNQESITGSPKELPTNCFVNLFDNLDFYKWKAKILSCEGSFYQGCCLILKRYFHGLSFKTTKICYIPPIYHLKINSQEQLSLDLLQNQWSPSQKISKILSVIYDVLENPDDPLDPEIAKIYQFNKQLFIHDVQEWIRKHAI